MTDRLLIGSDHLLVTLATSLSGQPGTVRTATTDDTVAQSLHEQNVPVEKLPNYETESLSTLNSPDLVGIFAGTPAQSHDLAVAAAKTFPDTHLVVYTGTGESETNFDDFDPTFDSLADTLVDPGAAIGAHLSKRIGKTSQRMQQLQRVLRDIESLAIVTHDNPDPDAIASALALKRLATVAGCTPEICYYGEITHQENRAFVNVLDIELRNLTDDDDLSEFDGLALVDHSRPGVNDQLPATATVDIVIDHHPPRTPIDARFVDLRSDVGATSTLLVDYLDRFNIPIDETVSTALLFGIHVDTNGFSREMSQTDFTAAATLVPSANFGMLERIETPSISPQTFETIANAISNRRIEGSVLLSGVGELAERDALAQAADRMLDLEGISTTLVYGVANGVIYVSARSRGTDIDLGERLREAFGQIGSAGGHVDMAGAQIELGVLEAIEDRDESLIEIVDAVVSSRFLDVISTQDDVSGDRIYGTESGMDAQFFAEEAPVGADATPYSGPDEGSVPDERKEAEEANDPETEEET